VTELPRPFDLREGTHSGTGDARRIGIVEDVIGGADHAASLAASFPEFAFQTLGAVWPEQVPAGVDVMIVPLDGATANELERGILRLRRTPPSTRVIVVLRNADLITTRRLIREGAADVLPAPASEPALALSLERLFHRQAFSSEGGSDAGQVVGLLKAGGGAGASSLGVQAAIMLARQERGSRPVCFADLDLQFGSASVYLDLPDAFSVTDCLAAGADLEKSPFAGALTKHSSGLRLLAAPQAMVSLEILTAEVVTRLIRTLKRDFALTIVDLPSVWTEWTNRTLQLCDRTVVVTRLSVQHVNLVRRQLGVLARQGLDIQRPILVCNAVTSEQQSALSVKAAETAIGRAFNAVIPADERIMTAATNQGLEISAVRRGTKLEKAIGDLARVIAADALTAAPASMRNRE
jgi:pilus assembly protein CpaE